MVSGMVSRNPITELQMETLLSIAARDSRITSMYRMVPCNCMGHTECIEELETNECPKCKVEFTSLGLSVASE